MQGPVMMKGPDPVVLGPIEQAQYFGNALETYMQMANDAMKTLEEKKEFNIHLLEFALSFIDEIMGSLQHGKKDCVTDDLEEHITGIVFFLLEAYNVLTQNKNNLKLNNFRTTKVTSVEEIQAGGTKKNQLTKRLTVKGIQKETRVQEELMKREGTLTAAKADLKTKKLEVVTSSWLDRLSIGVGGVLRLVTLLGPAAAVYLLTANGTETANNISLGVQQAGMVAADTAYSIGTMAWNWGKDPSRADTAPAAYIQAVLEHNRTIPQNLNILKSSSIDELRQSSSKLNDQKQTITNAQTLWTTYTDTSITTIKNSPFFQRLTTEKGGYLDAVKGPYNTALGKQSWSFTPGIIRNKDVNTQVAQLQPQVDGITRLVNLKGQVLEGTASYLDLVNSPDIKYLPQEARQYFGNVNATNVNSNKETLQTTLDAIKANPEEFLNSNTTDITAFVEQQYTTFTSGTTNSTKPTGIADNILKIEFGNIINDFFSFMSTQITGYVNINNQAITLHEQQYHLGGLDQLYTNANNEMNSYFTQCEQGKVGKVLCPDNIPAAKTTTNTIIRWSVSENLAPPPNIVKVMTPILLKPDNHPYENIYSYNRMKWRIDKKYDNTTTYKDYLLALFLGFLATTSLSCVGFCFGGCYNLADGFYLGTKSQRDYLKYFERQNVLRLENQENYAKSIKGKIVPELLKNKSTPQQATTQQATTQQAARLETLNNNSNSSNSNSNSNTNNNNNNGSQGSSQGTLTVATSTTKVPKQVTVSSRVPMNPSVNTDVLRLLQETARMQAEQAKQLQLLQQQASSTTTLATVPSYQQQPSNLAATQQLLAQLLAQQKQQQQQQKASTKREAKEGNSNTEQEGGRRRRKSKTMKKHKGMKKRKQTRKH